MDHEWSALGPCGRGCSPSSPQREGEPESVRRTDVKVTRGHFRAKTLQIRLSEDELAKLSALAQSRGLPVSTVARQLLLQTLAPADDLRRHSTGSSAT
jgi:hypothetical protein